MRNGIDTPPPVRAIARAIATIWSRWPAIVVGTGAALFGLGLSLPFWLAPGGRLVFVSRLAELLIELAFVILVVEIVLSHHEHRRWWGHKQAVHRIIAEARKKPALELRDAADLIRAETRAVQRGDLRQQRMWTTVADRLMRFDRHFQTISERTELAGLAGVVDRDPEIAANLYYTNAAIRAVGAVANNLTNAGRAMKDGHYTLSIEELSYALLTLHELKNRPPFFLNNIESAINETLEVLDEFVLLLEKRAPKSVNWDIK